MAQYIPAKARTVSNTSTALFMGESPAARQKPRVAQYMPEWSLREPVDNFIFLPLEPGLAAEAGAG
jgi:hypothetical protein